MGIRYPEGRTCRPREIGGRHVRKEEEWLREGGPEGLRGERVDASADLSAACPRLTARWIGFFLVTVVSNLPRATPWSS